MKPINKNKGNSTQAKTHNVHYNTQPNRHTNLTQNIADWQRQNDNKANSQGQDINNTPR